MKKRKLKPFVVTGMYVLSIAMLIASVYCVEKIISNQIFQSNQVEEVSNDDDIVDDGTNREMPVISTEAVIGRPYHHADVKIVKNFYDYQADEETQEGAIIYYGNTYMQNSGVDYGMDSEFEVVSIMDGTVMEVVEDEIMGKTVKIKHNDDLISVYSSMGEVSVEKDAAVTQGTIIGKSGEANVSRDLGNHLHFELYYKGVIVNPEEYYDKTVSQLN